MSKTKAEIPKMAWFTPGPNRAAGPYTAMTPPNAQAMVRSKPPRNPTPYSGNSHRLATRMGPVTSSVQKMQGPVLEAFMKAALQTLRQAPQAPCILSPPLLHDG